MNGGAPAGRGRDMVEEYIAGFIGAVIGVFLANVMKTRARK